MDDSFEKQVQSGIELLGLKSFFYACAAFGAAIPDDTQEFLVELVRNGCPLEVITKTAKHMSERKQKEGD